MGANQKVAADVRATTPDTSARALASPRLESMKQVSDVRALIADERTVIRVLRVIARIC